MSIELNSDGEKKILESFLKNKSKEYFYNEIIEFIIKTTKFKNEIEVFLKQRNAHLTVDEGNLEEFAKKYIRLIETFWETFFEKVLKKKYKNVGILVISEDDLLPEYRNKAGDIAYHPGSNTVLIVKERFLNDLVEMNIIDGDAGIISVFAHEIGHAVQNQTNNFHNRKTVNTELEADFMAGIVARIFLENGIFTQEYIKRGENTFLNVGLFGCDITHGTEEERLESFQKGFEQGKNLVHLVK